MEYKADDPSYGPEKAGLNQLKYAEASFKDAAKGRPFDMLSEEDQIERLGDLLEMYPNAERVENLRGQGAFVLPSGKVVTQEFINNAAMSFRVNPETLLKELQAQEF